MRQWLNDNPAVAIGGTVLFIVVALWIIVRPASSGEYEQAYFMNMATGEMVVMPASTLAPAPAPSGDGQVVSAIVMACGSCDDPSAHFIARLEMYTDEAKQLVQQIAANRPEDHEQVQQIEQRIAAGRLIAAPPVDGSEPQWMSMMTPAAAMLQSSVSDKCSGAALTVCSP